MWSGHAYGLLRLGKVGSNYAYPKAVFYTSHIVIVMTHCTRDKLPSKRTRMKSGDRTNGGSYGDGLEITTCLES